MLLYLARHGEAGGHARDALRSLTERGRNATAAVYREAAQRIETPIRTLLCSPLQRARETAELALQYLPLDVASATPTESLLPDKTPASVCDRLDHCDHWPVLLVGHQPLLGDLLAWLGDNQVTTSVMTTSSFVCLELIAPARGCGTVEWQLYPRNYGL